MILKVQPTLAKNIAIKQAMAVAGIGLLLSGCTHVPKGEMTEESYFPPLGLGQEAAALDARRSQHYTTSGAPHTVRTTEPVTNAEVPLDEVVFEDAAAFQTHSQSILPTSNTSAAPFRGASYTALIRH
ncbi:hypothetical protein [Ascidiaceihabitans sp.]|uniref:hypothetical protein n=1 Tax=Ascidiaceihabitans sp. TaxID=1872644 RepID=UPI003298DFE3